MYGTGTRSYNRSTERRENKRQCEDVTARWERGEIKFEPMVLLLCHCRSFRYAHPPDEHKKLLGDMDWRTPEQRAGQQIWEERIR